MKKKTNKQEEAINNFEKIEALKSLQSLKNQALSTNDFISEKF